MRKFPQFFPFNDIYMRLYAASLSTQLSKLHVLEYAAKFLQLPQMSVTVIDFIFCVPVDAFAAGRRFNQAKRI